MTQVIIRPADRNRLRQRAMSVPNVFDLDANGPAKADSSVPGPSAFPRYNRRGVARLCSRPSRLRTLMARGLFGICVIVFLRNFFPFSGTNGDLSGGFGLGWGFLRRHLVGLPERSRASSGEGWTLEEFLDYHLPLNLTQEEKAAHILFSTSLETGVPPPPLPQPYHLWLTAVNQYSFVEARSLTHFWKMENEARAAAGDKIVHVVTLCSDPNCLKKCKKVEHEMLCYGGFARDVPEHWDALDWTKACGARDVLESGRNVLLGSELVLRKDPFPRLERYFPVSDVIIAENVTGTDSGHLSTSLIWMRSIPETIELWYDVLDLIANATASHNLIETPEAGELATPDAATEVWTVLTLQEAFNEVLHSTELRVTDEFSEVRLRHNFNTGNGLRVHALSEEHSEIAAFNYLLDLEDINSPDDVYADASIVLMPCIDGGGLRSFLAKYHGMWTNVGAYYSKPAPSLRIKSMSGSRGALAIQLRIVLTLCKYTGRAFQVPETVTFTDAVDATLPVWRALPLSLITGPMGIRIHEPGFDSHAAKYHLKTEGVDDPVVEDRTEVELGKLNIRIPTFEVYSPHVYLSLDIRFMIGVDEIIKRLKSSVYSNAPRVVLIGFEPNAAAPWRGWKGAGPVSRINVCKNLKLEPRCGEICSGHSVPGTMPKKWPSLDKYLTPPKDDSAFNI